MVDLAKIRRKAKKRGAPPAPPPVAAEGTGAPQSPEAKLQKFLAEAGTRRFIPRTAVESAAGEVELLTFLLGRERYAIEIGRVAQIVAARPVTSVPNAPRGVVGIFSLRGSIVTLIDIRSRLRQPPRSGNGDARVIVIDDDGTLIGFEVDRVLRPGRVARASIEPQPLVDPAEESEAIQGVIRSEDSLTIVLDLFKLLKPSPAP